MHCPLCLNMKVSHLSWSWMALRNRPLATFARNFETPAVKRRPQNLTLLGRTLPNAKSRKSRKALVGICSLLTCSGDFGTIAWNMRPKYDLQHIQVRWGGTPNYQNWTGRYPKPSCPARLPALASFVSLAGFNG